MRAFSALSVLIFPVVFAALIFYCVLTPRNGVALLGLCWDVLGALTLGFGTLWRYAAGFTFSKELLKKEGTWPKDWTIRIPLEIASFFGSKDVRDTQEIPHETLADNFWGLLLLALGFLLQGVSQFL